MYKGDILKKKKKLSLRRKSPREVTDDKYVEGNPTVYASSIHDSLTSIYLYYDNVPIYSSTDSRFFGPKL